MAEFHAEVGDSARFSKTVGEYDVYGFAGITGDFSPNHTDKAYMEKSSYGRLQAQGRADGRLHVDRLDARHRPHPRHSR